MLIYSKVVFTIVHSKQQIIKFLLIPYPIQNWLLSHILFVAKIMSVKFYLIVISLIFISLITSEVKNVFLFVYLTFFLLF